MKYQTEFRLHEISKIEKCVIKEINKKTYSKKSSKYVAAFDYIDKKLIVLSGTGGGVCIISYVNVVGSPVGIAGASFALTFFFNHRNNKKITKHNKKQKEKAR